MTENPYGTHQDEFGYGTPETIPMCVTSVSSLKLRLKVCVKSKTYIFEGFLGVTNMFVILFVYIYVYHPRYGTWSWRDSR